MTRRRKVLFSVISVSLGLLIIEGGLRLAGSSYNPYRQFMLGVASEVIEEYDEHLFWKPAGPPNRDLEERPRNMPGVLVLSDSVGVLSGYPDALRRSLTRRLGGEEPALRDASVTGYSSHQGLLLLQQVVATARPDVVVVNFGFNDHWNSGNGRTDRQQRPPPGWMTRLVGSSSLLGLLAGKFLRRRLDHYVAYPLPELGAKVRVPPEEYQENLRRFVQLSAQHGFKLVLMTSPFMPPERHDSGDWIRLHQTYNEIVRQVCKASPRVLCLDPVGLLRYRPELWKVMDGVKDGVHFTNEGGKIVAEALAKIIAPELRRMAAPGL